MSSTIIKQGLISILGDQTKASSLRRTLSADMSSTKWLIQNGFSFSPMKRIASSEELATKKEDSTLSYDDEEAENPGQDDIWRLIQSQKKEAEKPCEADMWGSILTQKGNEEEDKSCLPPPYVHPLVKRTTSSLSEKSLEICTESLGSETGSDGFPSETGEAEEETQPQPQSQPQLQEKEWQSFDVEEIRFVKYNYSTTKKPLPKSFPPPLPSLAQRDGPSIHMQPHRQDGRLVLEAVSVLSQNCFSAHRQDGRLLLTIANSDPLEDLDLEEVIDQEEEKDEVKEEVFNTFGKEEEYNFEVESEEEIGEEGGGGGDEEEMMGKIYSNEGAKDIGIVMNQTPRFSSGIINAHRSAFVMKNLIALNNRDPRWTQNLKKRVNLVEMDVEMEGSTPPLFHSLTVSAAAASFNAYEYFWRAKPTVATMKINPIMQQIPQLKNNPQSLTILPNNTKAYEKKELVLLSGNKADYLLPAAVRGCKENNKRPLLVWEPQCVATS